MVAYKLEYPGAQPRMIEASTKRTAKAHAARSFTVTKIGAREVHELTEQGIELEQAGGQA